MGNVGICFSATQYNEQSLSTPSKTSPAQRHVLGAFAHNMYLYFCFALYQQSAYPSFSQACNVFAQIIHTNKTSHRFITDHLRCGYGNPAIPSLEMKSTSQEKKCSYQYLI